MRRQAAGEEEDLQAKGKSAGNPGAGSDLPARLGSLGPGRPLSSSTRSFFEPRFGCDFSAVRVVADSRGAETARSLNARAFTAGRNIVFGPGEYRPDHAAGRSLLAHELTHVVQQGAAREPGAGPGIVQRQLRRGDAGGGEATGAPSRGGGVSREMSRGGGAQGEGSRGGSGRGAGARRGGAAGPPPCHFTGEPGHPSGLNLLFAVDTYALTPAQRGDLARFVSGWRAHGDGHVNVDGYASVDGPLAYNARLSCNRARSVAGALLGAGVPRSDLSLYAHGETTEFSTSSHPPNRRAIVSTGTRRTPAPSRGPGRHRERERPTSVCGGIDEFFRTFLLIDPGPLSDIVTCVCFAAGIADLLPLGPESGPVEVGIEAADCLCNVLTTLKEIYIRGADGGCWSIANISPTDAAAIAALVGLTVVDCLSEEIGTALGGFVGGLLGSETGPGAAGTAAAGAELGGTLGGMIIDLAAMAAQNMITQGTPLPVAQIQACLRVLEGGGARGRRPGPRRPEPRRREPPASSRSFTGPRPPSTPAPGPSAPSTPPSGPRAVCGPNVTAYIVRALDHTTSLFHSWTSSQQQSACYALVEPPEAAFAWDIIDLHNAAKGGGSHNWIIDYRCTPPGSCPWRGVSHYDPRQVCATAGASPSCSASVQVGRECYYAGSANYVVFGRMMKLCHDTLGGVEFSETAARALVNAYKLGGLKGGNVGPAKAWASAGYHGWPSGGSPPSGDRANCSPSCPVPFSHSAFRICWCPYENPYAECLHPITAVESIIEHIL